MPAARRWTDWPARTVKELNGVSGIAGLGGIAIGAGSLTFLTGAVALTLTGVGAVVVVGAVATAVVKALPDPLTPASDLVGQVVELDRLLNVLPPIPKLSIIGPGLAGKTTLRNRLAFEFSPLERTQQMSAYIVLLPATPNSPAKYLAILDGRGDRFSQQFELAEASDCLCVVIDHNESDSDTSIDAARMETHRDFLDQIKHHLDQSHAGSKQWVHFLINKRDLWISAPTQERTNLINFCKDEADSWRKEKRAQIVDFREHSNNSQEDIARFMALLRSR